MSSIDLDSPELAVRGAELAQTAYDAFAPIYDRFTGEYEYDGWLAAIEDWALAHGLEGRDLLDVGCGTGKSFLPMRARGYRVSACDISPEMVTKARGKAPDVDVRVADMRALPWRACFDLVTCLDDSVNYLLTADDLEAALLSMAAALRPTGILIFDTNSLATYRSTFAEEFSVESGAWRIRWRGEAHPDFKRGGLASASIDAVGPEIVSASRHVQRHWPVEVLRTACGRAGFDHVAFRGQVPGGRLVGDPDDSAHSKIVCLAKRGSRRRAAPRRAGPRWHGVDKEDPVVVKT